MLATQCMVQHKPRSMRIRYEGELGFGVTAKDLILGNARPARASAALTGHVVEYAGPAIEALSMEGRMTVCNMTIEGGGRAGMIAPDETTFAWFSDQAAARRAQGRRAGCARSSAGARCAPTTARQLRHRGRRSTPRAISPQVTWGTNPGMVRRRHRHGARSRGLRQPGDREATERALALHGASSPAPRSRRSRSTASSSAPAPTPASATCAPPPRSSPGRTRRRQRLARWSCPGSQQVKAQAEAEGLDRVFRDAGFDWRVAGCSMCLGMNPDILAARRALRLDLEPQLRGSPGPRRAHPSRLPADGRRSRDRGALRRHPRLELSR